jgi:hypothetical protein
VECLESIFSPGSLETVSRELAKHKIGSMGRQEVRRDYGGTERADDFIFFYTNGNTKHLLGT